MVEVRGLRDLWARTTQRAAPADARPVPLRLLLDTRGLGLEQTMSHLGGEQPDWDAFVAWVEETAGPPDADRVARWHAWLDGAPPPRAEAERQAAVMAAPPVLSDEELAAWDRDGVVVLRSAVSRDEAAAIAAHLWSTVGADPDDPTTWYGRADGAGRRPHAARVRGIMVQHFQHPAMDVPRRSERVAKAFAQLHGHADLIASVDRLGLNPPEGPGFRFPGPHLHWDANLTPPMPFGTQGILYLTDTAADQGALQVVPGFHHRLADGWLEALDGVDPRTVDLSAEAVTVPAGAGDLVIWREEIPHGASPNRSDRPRLVQYLTHHPLRSPDDDRPWL